MIALLTGMVSTVLAVSLAAAFGVGSLDEPTGSGDRPAADQASARLTVDVVGLRSRDGQLIFGVFGTAKGFPSDERKSVNWQVLSIDADTVRFVCDLPPGKYAASVLHDENRNNKMDQNIFGVPKEGYGVTNNPKPRFRAARFNEATFTLPPEGGAHTISLQYF